MNWMDWAIVAWFSTGALFSILMIGEPALIAGLVTTR